MLWRNNETATVIATNFAMIWQWASKCSFQFAECFGGSVLQLLFLPTYRTLTAGYCCDLLNHVKCFNRSKRFNQLRRDVIVLYGHAAPHCSSHSRKRSKKTLIGQPLTARCISPLTIGRNNWSGVISLGRWRKQWVADNFILTAGWRAIRVMTTYTTSLPFTMTVTAHSDALVTWISLESGFVEKRYALFLWKL